MVGGGEGGAVTNGQPKPLCLAGLFRKKEADDLFPATKTEQLNLVPFISFLAVSYLETLYSITSLQKLRFEGGRYRTTAETKMIFFLLQ